jgi:carbamoyl-phosphate synthase large subunit
MKKINVLITGCGGDIGQSIGKILATYKNLGTLVGADISKENFGYLQFENFGLLPVCSSEDYYDKLKGLIEVYKIDLIIPASEPEIKQFFKDGYSDSVFGVKVLIASEKAISIGIDKYKTADFLKDNGLDYPQTDLLKDVDSCAYPSIIKDRTGSGSKKIFIIEDERDFQYYKSKYPGFIIQEYLFPDDEEYTCGLFKSSNGHVLTIIFRRKLFGGATGYGEVIKDEKIESLLLAIADKIELKGSINVQLRNTKRGPVVFEINPRFSSTVLFRHLLGFTDVVWSIQDLFGEKLSIEHISVIGRKIYRGYDMRIK